MDPVLPVYAGYSLRSGYRAAPGAELEPFVKEALEEIEYMTGAAATTWARAAPRTDIQRHSSSSTWKWQRRQRGSTGGQLWGPLCAILRCDQGEISPA
jgi:hypothetical protein